MLSCGEKTLVYKLIKEMNEKLVELFPKTNFYRTPVHLHVLPFLKVSLISANIFFNAFLVKEQQM